MGSIIDTLWEQFWRTAWICSAPRTLIPHILYHTAKIPLKSDFTDFVKSLYFGYIHFGIPHEIICHPFCGHRKNGYSKLSRYLYQSRKDSGSNNWMSNGITFKIAKDTSFAFEHPSEDNSSTVTSQKQEEQVPVADVKQQIPLNVEIQSEDLINSPIKSRATLKSLSTLSTTYY